MNRWLAPASLLLLGSLPIATGMMSLTFTAQGIAAGAPVNPDTVTYVAHPIPIFAHILAGALMTLLGPFQFLARLRGQTWHRWSGRVFVVATLAAALTGLWMNETFPAYGGFAKYASILIFGVAMIASVLIALWRIRRRDMPCHRTWMIRTYAIGLGPATQRVLIMPYMIAFDFPEGSVLGLMLAACWLFNLGVAEWIIRRPAKGSQTADSGQPSSIAWAAAR